ncbi:MAG: glycosyltransferase family 4 protein [Blastocatellia bacterium]
MKLAYVTTYSSSDIRKFSGLAYHIGKAFTDQSIALDVIDSLSEPFSPVFKAKQAAYRFLAGKRHLRDREPFILRSYAGQVAKKLANTNCDAVFSPGTISLSYLDCNLPIVFWTDATFAGMVDFYPEFSKLSAETVRNGNRAEQAALSRCRLALYASDWAARSAIENYQVDPSKVQVVPFGANLENNPTYDDVKAATCSRPKDLCRLLFLGADWSRKGGDLAIEVTRTLNGRGIRSELTIAGCAPPSPQPTFVRSLGFINKALPDEAARLDRLLAESHFLIVPSRAECFGHVFCEASAFGVPSLTTNVGGIPTAVRDNLNGKTFPIEANADEYCDYIEEILRNEARYRELASSAFNEYQTRLNWQVAGRTAKQLIHDYCSGSFQ